MDGVSFATSWPQRLTGRRGKVFSVTRHPWLYEGRKARPDLDDHWSLDTSRLSNDRWSRQCRRVISMFSPENPRIWSILTNLKSKQWSFVYAVNLEGFSESRLQPTSAAQHFILTSPSCYLKRIFLGFKHSETLDRSNRDNIAFLEKDRFR